ncbi:cyclic peptide transporter, partial [Burkholderia gladioli]|nr:cyclic peptide transporter [Burkholderia gladioli]
MDESSKSGLAGPAATRIGAAASAKSVVRENPARPEGAPGRLHKQYRAITEGAKELRINRDRRQRVFGVRLAGAADQVADLKIKAMRLYYGASASVTTLFFIVIGVLLLLQQRLGVSPEVVSGFVIVLLYVRGPVETIA